MNKENTDLAKPLNAETRIGDFPMAPSAQDQGTS
jgi:hypothetical protein